MHIIPVLDIQHGVVVRGVAGERDSYKPIESCLTNSTEPVAVLNDLQAHLGRTPVYVADLDAIRFGNRDTSLWKSLTESSNDIWLDCGVHNEAEAVEAATSQVASVVVALETIDSSHTVRCLMETFGSRIVFSIDLADGKPLASAAEWQSMAPEEIARELIEFGCRRFIVLDLKAVGVASGVPTIALCREIRELAPDCEITTGGGVRSIDDLLQLQQEGIHGVLIASALHNGSITREQLARASLLSPANS